MPPPIVTHPLIAAALVVLVALFLAIAALSLQRVVEERRIRRDTPPRPQPDTVAADIKATSQSPDARALRRIPANKTFTELDWQSLDAERRLDRAFDRFTNAAKEATRR